MPRTKLEKLAWLALVPLVALSVTRAQDDEPLKDGQWLYTRHCAGCHNDNGDGKGPTITQMGLVARDFAQGGFAFGDSLEQLKRTITSGIPGRSPMPSFKGVLADEEMDLVIGHVRTLCPKRDEGATKNTEMLVVNRPVIARGKLPPITEGAKETPRGLLIGTTEGMTFEYDVDHVRLLGVRMGRFADREDWGERGGAYLKPLGRLIWDRADGLDVAVEPRPEASYCPLGVQRRVLTSSFVSAAGPGLEYEVRDHDGKGRVLATLRESVRTRTTSFGPAIERSWRVRPGSLMQATLVFSPAEAEQSKGAAVSWFAHRRGADGVDVTAVRRVSTTEGVEQWTATSIRLPAWAPKLAAFLEQELAQ
ncbi:MAG: cytochrome c [Planctomycetes bacterium]|nr:cytochrome c [Planctomycetota bacterium]